MPSRDADGKRLSGHAQRRRFSAPLPRVSRTAAQAFNAIGPPPQDDPDQLLVWGRRMLAATAWLAATGAIDPVRARLVKDSVFAIGATHNRGAIEARVVRVERAVDDKRRPAGAVRLEPASKVPRPPTARGGAPTGPRVVPDEPTTK
jgi:hypothetical protein